MTWRLNGTKWAIILNSTLGQTKRGCSPVPKAGGLTGRSSPTSTAFDGGVTSDSPSHLSSSLWFPSSFLFFLPLPERIYSHSVTRTNLRPFCRDSVHFHHRDTQRLYGFAGGEVGRVRGSLSQGTPPLHPLSRLSTVFYITDKLWQMGSGKWFLHTHMISAITLLLPPSPHSAHCFSWEGPYQCEEVTEGNANLT